MKPALELDGVVKQYRGRRGVVTALDGVSLTVEAGRFVAVRGPSGCGKTTMLLAAGGLLAPGGGRVAVDGVALYGLDASARAAFRACTIGFVFQQYHLLPYLTVEENVCAAAIATGENAPRTRAEELIERFGLSPRSAHVPAELSTGEKQRVALARALMNRPRLLLADEPTGNLDEDNAAGVLAALKQFADDGGAVLLVTHDARAAGYAHQTVVMRAGRLE